MAKTALIHMKRIVLLSLVFAILSLPAAVAFGDAEAAAAKGDTAQASPSWASVDQPNGKAIGSFSDLEDKRIGVSTGSVQALLAEERFPDAKLFFFFHHRGYAERLEGAQDRCLCRRGSAGKIHHGG